TRRQTLAGGARPGALPSDDAGGFAGVQGERTGHRQARDLEPPPARIARVLEALPGVDRARVLGIALAVRPGETHLARAHETGEIVDVSPVSSLNTPRPSQMIWLTPRYSRTSRSTSARLRLGLRLALRRHSSVTSAVPSPSTCTAPPSFTSGARSRSRRSISSTLRATSSCWSQGR